MDKAGKEADKYKDDKDSGKDVPKPDPVGAVTRYEHDRFGRIVAVTDPMGDTTRSEWTVEGRLVRRSVPGGASESWTYDSEGNALTHTDSMGAVSHFAYTHFDLPTARTGPDGVRYTFAYDQELRLTQVTNPQGLAWSYIYDSAGRVTSETDFDGRVVTYVYDQCGQLASRTNALGETVRYERDTLGQIIRKDAAGAVTTFDYDALGHLVHAAGPEAVLSLRRDPLGLVLEETVNDRTTTYTYDAVGRRASRTTPSGATSKWSYDAAGHGTALTVGQRTIKFDHDPAGRELARHIGEDLTLANSYDSAGRLAAQSVSGSANQRLQHRRYHYRPDGCLVSLDDALNGSRSFDLDPAGRVTAVRAAQWTERYVYDEAGNQAEASWPTAHPGQEAAGTRAYTGTRITRAGGMRYEHDGLGRVVSRQQTRLSRKRATWTYGWNSEDRLTSVVTPDGTEWRYLYDPVGRRIAKQRLAADGTSVVEETNFTWDGSTLCEQTTERVGAPNPVTLTWDHRGLHPIAQTERICAADAPQEEVDSRFFAIVTDLIGTPTELLDESGDIVWRTRATLWGTTTWAADSTAYTPLRFPGQYFDPESGLHYNHFRHYDPETARYVSPDPLGLAPSPNPLAYVHNPHTWMDPLGLKCTKPPEGHSSQPAFRGDPYHPDVVEQRIQDMRKQFGIKEPPPRGMIGANGTQVTSKTMWNHGPYRIDVENPNPGQRAGQMHFQDVSNPTAKYQYNFDSGKFDGLPRSVEKAVGGNQGFQAGIRKGLRMLGEE